MAKEKEDVLQANAGAPAADIPNLKKKEKERKKAGAAWSGARGAASEFSGATGGTVSRAAASAAANLAAEGALVGAEGVEGGGLWAAISRFLAGLTSTLLGKMAVAAAAFVMMAAAGILGYGLLKGNGSAGVGSLNLGGIADSMHVRAGGDDRLGVNSRGELRFDPLSAAKKPAAPAVTDAKAAAATPAPAEKVAAADEQKPVPSGQLEHNLSGAKLSSSLGGDFGNKNIFAGNSNAPKFGAGAGNLSNMGGAKGKLGSMKASTSHATASARVVKKGSANRAFGQLRLAKALSLVGQQTGNAEQASAAAQGAFDQQQPTDGSLATNGAPGGDTPPSATPSLNTGDPGAAATDPCAPTATSSDPCSTSGTDPGLQSALAQITAMANQAMTDMMEGMALLVVGAVLVTVGIALESGGPWTWGWGAAMIIAGVLMLGAGALLVSQALSEQQKAMDMGKQLANNIGDLQQSKAVDYCTQQSVKNHTSMDQCQPPDSVTNQNQYDETQAQDIKNIKDGQLTEGGKITQ